MPRRDDDEFEDDDRPRRRPRDEDDVRPARSRRDDPDGDRPRRRFRDGEDEDDARRPPPRKKSNLGLILGILGGVLFLCCGGAGVGVYFFAKGMGDAAERVQSTNDLRQIGLACHNYNDTHNGFPTNSYAPDGRPLLSWRVHILPYVEQENLYRQFRLNDPWDSPNNLRLLSQMPKIYATPDQRAGRVPMDSKTYYRGFSSPGAVFARRPDRPGPGLGFEQPFGPRPTGVRMNDMKDGTSNTIVALEAGDPVEWTRPDDLDASPGKPFPRLGGARPKSDVVLVLFADGAVKAVKKDTAESVWRAAVTYAGNDVVSFD
jgi:hypothetical protein